QIQGLGLEHLLAAERQQLAREGGGAFGSLADLVDIVAFGIVRPEILEQQGAVTGDHGQQVVEIVGGPAGQTPNRLLFRAWRRPEARHGGGGAAAPSGALRNRVHSSRLGSADPETSGHRGVLPVVHGRQLVETVATPPARRPTASIFCAWRRRSSELRSASSARLRSMPTAKPLATDAKALGTNSERGWRANIAMTPRTRSCTTKGYPANATIPSRW